MHQYRLHKGNEKEAIINNVTVNVQLLTGGMWPSQHEVTVKLPSSLVVLQQDFEMFYKRKF